MKLDIDPEDVLQEPDLQAIEGQIDTYIQNLALLGDIESARELASAQLAVPPAIVGSWTQQSWHFAWKEIGQLPDGISQDSHEDALEAARQDYDENWPGIAEEHRTFDEAGLKACLEKADVTGPPRWTFDRCHQLVKALDISLRLADSSGESDDQHRSKRRRTETEDASTSTQLHLSDLDSRSADIIKQLVTALTAWDYPPLKTALSASSNLWPYFSRGLLASALNLTLEQVRTSGRLIASTYAQRLQTQPPPPYADKTILELIHLANENTLKHTDVIFWGPNNTPPTTLLHPPATESEISALEERLKTTLPQDFKEFLSLTNGFGHGDQGIFTGVFPEPNLHSTSELAWKEFDEFWVFPIRLLDLPMELEELCEEGELPQELGRVLVLGSRDVDIIWLIEPEKVKETVEVYKEIYEAGDEVQRGVVDRAIQVFCGGGWEEFEALDWCCVSADLGGGDDPIWYGSFRKYLEESVWSGRKVYDGPS